ncbi:unnamed protein product, partial [Coregonus sp. 'balchen']
MEYKGFSFSASNFFLALFLFLLRTSYGDVTYSFPEEMKRGSVIGNIGKDLGLDPKRLSVRKARLEMDELKDMAYEDSSKLTSYLIIALVSVSTFFLTFIILILAVRFCHRRKPRMMFDGAVAIPSAYFPPNYAEVDGAGTLHSSYNYDAYLTTGSCTSDFKFFRSYNDSTLPADPTLKRNQIECLGESIITLNDVGDYGDVTYSFPEEMKRGSEIGNIAKDLGLDPKGLSVRKARLEMDVSVSTFFLTFIILILAMRFCSRRKPTMLFDGAVAVPSAYFPPNYAEVDGAGTLRSSYNYDAYLTTGSRTSDFKFVRSYNDITLPADLTLKKSQIECLGESIITLNDAGNTEDSSKLTSYLIIALVSVSTFFLTFIILILAVRFCRRRKPRMMFDGAVAIPSAYFPPNYAEVDGAGTLRSSYNYDAYLTTGSRTSDFNFVRSYNDITLPSDLTLKRSQLCLVFFLVLPHTTHGDTSYSSPEEAKRGFIIGNIAKDLGLDAKRLSDRKARQQFESLFITNNWTILCIISVFQAYVDNGTQ